MIRRSLFGIAASLMTLTAVGGTLAMAVMYVAYGAAAGQVAVA